MLIERYTQSRSNSLSLPGSNDSSDHQRINYQMILNNLCKTKINLMKVVDLKRSHDDSKRGSRCAAKPVPGFLPIIQLHTLYHPLPLHALVFSIPVIHSFIHPTLVIWHLVFRFTVLVRIFEYTDEHFEAENQTSCAAVLVLLLLLLLVLLLVLVL